MKIKIGAKDLQKRVDILSRVAKTKTTLPVLDYFKFEVTEDELTLTASDLEVTVVTRVQPEEIKETGSVCVQADKFTEVIKNFKDCVLDLSLSSRQVDGRKVDDLIIKSKSGKFKIPCVDSEDFPQLQEPDQENSVTIDSAVLVGGINKTLFAASHNDLAPIICGVHIAFKTDRTTFVATDRNRIGIMYSDVVSPVDQAVTLPTKVASIIPSVFSDGNEPVCLSLSEKAVKIEGVNYTLYSKLLEGEYVNYEQVLEAGSANTLTVNTEALLDTIKRTMIFCPVQSSVVALNVTEGKLLILGDDKDFNLSAEEELECTNQVGEASFLINGRYLLEIIQKITTPSVEVSFSDTHPIVFFKPVEETKEKYLFVLLKMK